MRFDDQNHANCRKIIVDADFPRLVQFRNLQYPSVYSGSIGFKCKKVRVVRTIRRRIVIRKEKRVSKILIRCQFNTPCNIRSMQFLRLHSNNTGKPNCERENVG